MMSEYQMKKPPLGLIPRKYIDTQRWHEINAAISRYMEAGKEIPDEWIEERAEIELRSSGRVLEPHTQYTLSFVRERS